MSNRHRSSKQAVPGAVHQAPDKLTRRAANRKARHRTHEMLAHADVDVGEDIVAPAPVHTRVDVERAEAERSPKPRREYRHWKQKFWKRRNNLRAMKAQLQTQELPLRDVS
jgi:hypothetical protein